MTGVVKEIRVSEEEVVQVGDILIRLPCFAFDHRIADGFDDARFIAEVVRLLEAPRKLMLD